MSKMLYKMNEDEINEFVQKHLPIKKKEKDKYGEVFTNPILINKMLDLFPSSIWNNHSLSWLDPSVGIGFFMIFVYIRLMKGLKKWEPDDKKRSKHIIKNMLYMVEINKTNCDVCKELFGDNVNLICGDFLSVFDFNNRDEKSFDCIVGNPPFQDDHGLTEKGKRINGGKNKLYERIFMKSYDMLKRGGYISFVVPDNIFSGNKNQSYSLIIQNHVPFVSFNPSNQSYFKGIEQPVCYFLMKKNEKPGITHLEHDDEQSFNIVLKDRPVNPIRDWTPNTERLVDKYVGSNRNVVSYIRGKNLKSYRGDTYNIIYSDSKTLHTNNEKLAPGIGVKKAVIFSISPELSFEMDYNGKCGAGPNTFIVPFETNAEGKRLERFLNSDDYKTLALATKTTRQYLKIAFIEYLKLTKIMNANKNKTKKHKNGSCRGTRKLRKLRN